LLETEGQNTVTQSIRADRRNGYTTKEFKILNLKQNIKYPELI